MATWKLKDVAVNLNFTEKHLTVGKCIKVTGYKGEVYKVKRPFPVSFDLYTPDERMFSFSTLGALKENLLKRINLGSH